LVGKKAWFLLRDSTVEVNKPVVLKRSGPDKNARNLQAVYIFHAWMAPDVLQEVLSLDARMKNTHREKGFKGVSSLSRRNLPRSPPELHDMDHDMDQRSHDQKGLPPVDNTLPKRSHDMK